MTIDLKRTHLNIGTIGHVDHGKTTLSAAITTVLAKVTETTAKNYDQIDNAPEEKARGITINAQTIEVMTERRHYGLTDCPGHADFMKNMLVGAAQLDCVILVLSGADSFQAQTKAHLSVVTQMKIKKIIVFINKMDVADEGMLPLVEMEIEEEMSKLGYSEAKTPAQYDDINFTSQLKEDNSSLWSHDNELEYVIVKGSGFAALNGDQGPYGVPAVMKLVKILDDFIPNPIRDETSPFLMYVEAIYHIAGRGTVIAGKVTRGKLKTNDTLQIMCQSDDADFNVVATEIQTFKRKIDYTVAGDNTAILLRGDNLDKITRGAAACAPNSCKKYRGFSAMISFWADEKANKKANETRTYHFGYEPQFFIYTASITGTLGFTDDNWKFDASLSSEENTDNVKSIVELQSPVALPIDSTLTHTFSIREGNMTRGGGTIHELFENAPNLKAK